jgi:hypothetical protein
LFPSLGVLFELVVLPALGGILADLEAIGGRLFLGNIRLSKKRCDEKQEDRSNLYEAAPFNVHIISLFERRPLVLIAAITGKK